MTAVLEARGLGRTFPGTPPVRAARGVDLAVAAGEFVALMGPSGCGKSTLLHLLGGLDVPDAGELSLQGRRVDTLGEAARARLRRRTVGYVFQSLNLVASLTARENVEQVAARAGERPARARHDPREAALTVVWRQLALALAAVVAGTPLGLAIWWLGVTLGDGTEVTFPSAAVLAAVGAAAIAACTLVTAPLARHSVRMPVTGVLRQE